VEPGRLQAHKGNIEAHPGAIEAHPRAGIAPHGAVAAHLGAVEGLKVSMADSHQFADGSGPHQSERPDPDTHRSEKSDLDAHQRDAGPQPWPQESILESSRTQCME
jgi:hypothetical protein